MIAWNNTEGYRSWKLSQFTDWYEGLKQHFGDKRTADGKYLQRDAIWAVYWVASETPPYTKLASIVAAPSLFKSELKYLEKEAPYLYSTMGFKTAVETGKYNPVDKGAQLLKGGLGVAEGVAGALETSGKILRVALPLALAFSLILGGIWAYNKYGKNAAA